MAGLVLGLAGAALLGPMGIGVVSASTGYLIGSSLAALAGAGKNQTVEGPRITDMSVQVSTYGSMVPVLYGAMRTAGNVIYCTDKREHRKESTSRPGKGGPKITTVTFSYDVDIAIALADCEIAGIRKVWMNSKLVFDASDSSATSVLASSFHAQSCRIYTGTETQLPDATIEAGLGAGNVPAYRGTAYIVLGGLDCPNGVIPQMTFEVVTQVSPSSSTWSEYAHTPFTGGTGDNAHGAASKDGIYTFHRSDRTVNHVTPTGSPVVGLLPAGYVWVSCKGQGGPNFLAPAIPGPSYSDPAYVMRCTAGGSATVLAEYVPSSKGPAYGGDYALRCEVCAYDVISGKFVTKNNGLDATSGGTDFGQRAVILPGFTVTPNASLHPFTPLAFYDDVIYVLTISGGNTLLQTFSGSTGASLNPLLATIPALGDLGVTRIQVDDDGIFVFGYFGTSYCVYFVPIAGGTPQLKISGLDVVYAGGSNTWQVDFYATQSYVVWGVVANLPTSGNAQWRIQPYAAITPDDPSLADIIQDICVRCGLELAQLDVTGLTDTVHGYALTHVATGRANIEPLMRCFFVDAVESDGKLKFRKRALQTSVASIAFDELAAVAEGGTTGDPLQLTRQQEAELPRSVAVNFINWASDYQPGTERGRRQVTKAVNDQVLDMPIAIDADRAASAAEGLLYDAWNERNKRRLAVTRKFAALDATDLVTVEYPQGTFTLKRLTSASDDGRVVAFDCTDGDPAIYAVAAIGATPASAQQGVQLLGRCIPFLADVPIFRDADNNAGIYVGLVPQGGAFPGGVLYSGQDTASLSEVSDVSIGATAGYALTTLGDWSLCTMDQSNSVRVSLMNGTLSNASRDAVLDSNANVAVLGDEIIAFTTATLVSTGIYDLSGLLRGLCGTEHARSTHAVGDQFLLVSKSTLMRPVSDASQLNQTRYWRGVTYGTDSSRATAVERANTAVGLKPYAPVNLRRNTDSGALVVTWDRRTRLSADVFTNTFPLGEVSEQYEVELLDSGGNVVATTTVSESQYEVGSVASGFALSPPAQMITSAGGDLVGCLDKLPVQSSDASLRRYDAADGHYLGGMSTGGQITALTAVGSTLYVSTVDGVNNSYVRKVDRAALTLGATPAFDATYTAPQAADCQGVAHDGTNLWVSLAYSDKLAKLNASTLVSAGVYTVSSAPGAMVYAGGFLWVCARGSDEIVKVDPATGSVSARFSCTRFPMDILVVGSLVFVAGAGGVGVYTTGGVQLALMAGGTDSLFRRAFAHYGSEVVFRASDELVFLNDATGQETRRVSAPGAQCVAGGTSSVFFVATRVSGALVTLSYEQNAAVSGGALRVYQLSEAVGRGVPAEIDL